MTRVVQAAIFALVLAADLVGAGAARADGKSVLIATWRGCEDACRGFQEHLGGLGEEVSFVLRDAGQDKSALPAILEEARAREVDLIVTWGTSVTRGIAGTLATLDDPAYDHDIPLVFMIVADPVGSDIVASLDATGRDNVTGTYNRMPESVTIQTIRSYMPGFRRLGLLYNANEANSVLKREEMAALAESEGFELVALPLALGEDGFPLAEDIAPKMRALARAEVDFVYLGSSSFLRANGALLGAAAEDAGLPLLSPYEEMVRKGDALISVAASYREVGRLAGRQAEAILFEGQPAGTLPVARMERFAVTINLTVAKALHRFPPMELLQIADIVE